jgi:ArsR family transcriptional regulator, lead/cadmium/zinc/bismuth-responsive transcriptional repressor
MTVSSAPEHRKAAAARSEPLSEDLAVAMAELFRALADPSRARIVSTLADAEQTTSGLAALLSMSLPSVSQHLRVLRTLRIVKPRREGRLVHYSLDDSHIRLLVTLTLTHLQEERGRSVPALAG